MSSLALVGRRVMVTLTDPWDFVTENGAEITGSIAEARGENELVIRLEREIRFEGLSSRLLTVRPRHRGVGLNELIGGGEIGCNLTAVADGSSQSPLGQALFSAIGSLRL